MRWCTLSIGLLLACGGPPPRPWTEPQVLFPERPELDAFAPSRPWILRQETWTERGPSLFQHCHEWSVPREREPVLADEARAGLRRIGIEPGSGTDLTRGNGLDVVLAPRQAIRIGDERTAYPKLIVCTNGVAPRNAYDSFVAQMRSDPLYPENPPPLGTPYIEWRRHYTSGATQIGLAWMAISGVRARGWLDENGFDVRRRDHDVVWMENGLSSARVSDGSLWWDRSDRSYP